LSKFGLLASRLSTSRNGIESDTDRSGIHDFLLLIHCNRGPISYRFREKRRFRSKNTKNSYPPVYLWSYCRL